MQKVKDIHCINCMYYNDCTLIRKGKDTSSCLDYKGVSSLFKTTNIDHPSHYNQGGVETIDSIKSVTGDEYNGYLAGNVIKYMGRYKHKGNPIKDLQKALWHIEKLIKEIEEKEIQK